LTIQEQGEAPQGSSETQQQQQQQQQYVSPIQLFFIAKELQKKGKRVIFLSAGEPDYPPPREVVEATYEAMKNGFTHYAPSKGIPELRKALAEHVNHKYPKSNISPEQIVVTLGGRFAIYSGFRVLTRPGDEAIILSPDWSAYRDVCNLIGVGAVFARTFIENDWDVDLDQIRKLITEKTKVLVITYPNNPTGKIVKRTDFDCLVDLAREHNITIMSDEVYADYIFNEKNEFKSILECENCKYFFLTSFSKSYAMTGFRMGYCISDEETMKKVERFQSIVMTSIPEFIQYGGIKALQCKEDVRENVERMKGRVATTMKILREIPTVECYYPDGGLYVFPKINSENFDSAAFALDLLKEHYVSIANGQAFGGQIYRQYFRLALVEPDKLLTDGLEKLEMMLRQKGLV
jgi:aspartate aminotransferase